MNVSQIDNVGQELLASQDFESILDELGTGTSGRLDNRRRSGPEVGFKAGMSSDWGGHIRRSDVAFGRHRSSGLPLEGRRRVPGPCVELETELQFGTSGAFGTVIVVETAHRLLRRASDCSA